MGSTRTSARGSGLVQAHQCVIARPDTVLCSGNAVGLSESVSDCCGSMFRQWEANEGVKQADQPIGHDIMGPAATAEGYRCLQNMSDPADKRCLAPQPTRYSQIKPGMDPHYSSGPPNLAFCIACLWWSGWTVWLSAELCSSAGTSHLQRLPREIREAAPLVQGPVRWAALRRCIPARVDLS